MVLAKYEEARTNLSIDITNFNIRLKKIQFNSIIKMLNKINSYQKFQNKFYETRNYKYFRPEKFISKKHYLRYGICMVIKRIHYNRGIFNIFDIPESDMKLFENNFLSLFPVYLNTFSLEDFSQEKKALFKRAVEVVDIDILYSWSIKGIRNFFIQKKKRG